MVHAKFYFKRNNNIFLLILEYFFASFIYFSFGINLFTSFLYWSLCFFSILISLRLFCIDFFAYFLYWSLCFFSVLVSSFMAVYLYPTNDSCILVPSPFCQLICIIFLQVVQIMNFFWCYLGQICNKFGANLASKYEEFMQKKHLKMVLSGTNLVSNITIKKHHE